MAFIIKHFVDLFNYKFNIPSYQRGYRWEKKQIEDLLSDLAEFKNSCSENKSFYCLQAVVVTKNNNVTTFFALKGKRIHCQSQNLSFNLSWRTPLSLGGK